MAHDEPGKLKIATFWKCFDILEDYINDPNPNPKKKERAIQALNQLKRISGAPLGAGGEVPGDIYVWNECDASKKKPLAEGSPVD